MPNKNCLTYLKQSFLYHNFNSAVNGLYVFLHFSNNKSTLNLKQTLEQLPLTFSFSTTLLLGKSDFADTMNHMFNSATAG